MYTCGLFPRTGVHTMVQLFYTTLIFVDLAQYFVLKLTISGKVGICGSPSRFLHISIEADDPNCTPSFILTDLSSYLFYSFATVTPPDILSQSGQKCFMYLG